MDERPRGLLCATRLIVQARGLAPVLLRRAACVQLDWDVRQKSRFEAVDSHGRRIGVFLERGTLVRGGDVLVVEDGSLLRVEAAAQAVMVVRPCAAHGTPADLLRAAYHLGNRHVAVELRPDRLHIEPDHVLAAMLHGLGLAVAEEQAPFEPEGGAYGTGRGASHGHGHGHGHGHDATRAAGHAHPDAGHGPGCVHDHGEHRGQP